MNLLDMMGPPITRAGSAENPGQVQKLLSNPFILNILAQQGQSLTPGPGPLGVIGRAGIATQQQQQQSQLFDLQKRLMESQVGLNQAKLTNPAAGSKPETAVAKILADRQAGLLNDEQTQRLIDTELRKGSSARLSDVNSLRGQYRTDVSGPRASLSGLAAAEGLLSANNAIGDTAAFTSFIRSIDNSVVRPAEQDAYNKALGVRNYIEATVQQWAGKGPLPPETKRALLDSIRTLRGIMEGIADRTTEYYGKEAEKAGLDRASVVGIPVKFDQVDIEIPGAGGGSAVDLPPLAVQDGITQEEWQAMPEKDRDLWRQ